jgi:hypothetical protein
LNIVKPNNMQIFGKEKEIPLFMVDGGDNSFDSGDYFLFYAERNDGWLDSTLYTNPTEIGNPNYSLYNDTLTYFFTWNSLNTNSRYANENDGNFGAHPPAPYIWWEQSFGYQNEYYEGKTIGNLSTSFYNDGEGYMFGKYIGPATVPFNFNTSHRYNGPGAPDAYFQGKSFSTNNPSIPSSGTHNHHLRWKVGTQDSLIFDTLWVNIRPIHFQGLIPAGSLNSNSTPIKWNNVGDQPSGNDSQGFSYTRLKFAKEPNLNGFTEGKFKVVNSTSTNKIRLDIIGLTTSAPMVFVHGGIPRQLYLVPNGTNNYQTLIPNASGGI